MKLQGHIVVILCSLLIQFSPLSVTRYIVVSSRTLSRVAVFAVKGLTFLVYPLLGHLADVCLTRYRTLKWSFIFHIVGCTVILLHTTINLTLFTSLNGYIFQRHLYVLSALILATGAFLCIVGLGLFQAIAVQFGLDQLLEAPTKHLVAYIHWYYWSQNIGPLVIFYIAAGLLSTGSCNRGYEEERIAEFVGCVVLFLIALATLFLFCCSKKKFYIERAGLNPFKNTYKVLKYAWKHKVPENRSAFTYWEDDIPPRIDLGKDKYGGPFTTEEVEDTKTFLSILPLLLSLFGFHLAGDGFFASEELQRSSCPSLPVLIFIVGDPLHISALVTVVGIPLYRLVIRKVLPCLGRVCMLTRMWMGLFLSLLQVIVYITLAVNHDTSYWQQNHSSVKLLQPTSIYTQTKICFDLITGIPDNASQECRKVNDFIDNSYLWFIVPQLLNGLSSLFVSMTTLEFICAQAPRTTQGMLIGLWYATFSIRYLVTSILGTFISERKSWLIYEGVKGFLILVSLVLFSCVSRYYRYRQRDEIVNVQWMIEEIVERQIDQEEEYMQERRALLASGSGHTNIQL